MRYARRRLPSSGSLGSRFPAFAASPVFSHRYYARLRLPFLRLGLLRLTLASRYLVLARLCSCPLSGSPFGREDDPTSTWPFSSPACLTGCHHKEMTVLSSSRATPLRACPARGPRWCPLHSPSRLQDSCLPAQSNRRLSSAHAELSLTDHNYKIFGAQSRGLHARYTWLHTHPCGICMQVHYRFGGSPPPMGLARSPALTHWVTSTDFTRSFPIPRFRAYLDAKLLFLGST